MRNKPNRLGKTKQAALVLSRAQIERLVNMNGEEAAETLEALYRRLNVDRVQDSKKREVGDIIDNDVCLAFTRSGAEADAGRKMTDSEWLNFAHAWREWSLRQGHQEAWQRYYFFELHPVEYPNAVNPDTDEEGWM